MKDEIWRDVKGYEGLYEVSDLGRVRSLRDGKEHVLVGCKDAKGYLFVNLYKDGKKKCCKVHRLVAEAFIPNPYNLPQVNHINECKQSNVVTNLEWCDAAYNSNYGTRNERIIEKLGKTIYQYTKSGEFVRSYPSTREAARQTGIPHSNICAVVLGNRNHAGNYRWSFDPPTPTTNRALF